MLRLLYQPSRFSERTVDRMPGHWQELLRGFVARPDAGPGDLEFLVESERRQVLQEWNDTAREYPREDSVAQKMRMALMEMVANGEIDAVDRAYCDFQ